MVEIIAPIQAIQVISVKAVDLQLSDICLVLTDHSTFLVSLARYLLMIWLSERNAFSTLAHLPIIIPPKELACRTVNFLIYLLLQLVNLLV